MVGFFNEKINGKSYQKGKTLGKGGFGEVIQVKSVITKEFFALKIIKKKNLDEKLKKYLGREVNIMKSLDHPFVIKFIDSVETEDYMKLLLEFIPNGNLEDFIKIRRFDKKDDTFIENKKKIIFTQILNGVKYLHSQKIAHRDLKPQNILLDKFNNVKIADFGLANHFQENSLISFVGTRRYIAPEVAIGHYNGFKADIFSLGVILYDILTEFSKKELGECFEKGIKLSDKLQERDPEKRLSLENVLEELPLTTLHVGVDACFENLLIQLYYDEFEKTTVDLKIDGIFDGMEIVMFDKIKSKLYGNLGCVCIYLDTNYINDLRKMYIESGFKSGLKNVEIINETTAFYLEVMSQIEFKPTNGNVIWILEKNYENSFYESSFHVWQIIDHKAKYILQTTPQLSPNVTGLQNIVTESKLNKGPDVVIYDDEININKNDFADLNEISQCSISKYHNNYEYHESSLLKARITSGEHDVAYFDVHSFLDQSFILYMGTKKIKESSFLGIFEPFNLPNYEEIYLTFKIDTNEIYSVSFSDQSNESDTNLEL